MSTFKSGWLIVYGVFLFAVAIAAVMYDPGTGAVGFNPAAKTALISGGVCGGLSIGFGLLAGRGVSWSVPAAGVAVTLFLAAFTWRSIASWRAYAGGNSEKWYAASLITLMWIGSFIVLLLIVRSVLKRRGRSAEPA